MFFCERSKDMPLYEYECKACGVRFERQQAVSDDPVKTCPECGGEVHRLIHPVGVIFKGKGFYVTDNRKAKSSTLALETREKSEGIQGEGGGGKR
jgi:putative FmdB family regulatory protein